MILPDSVEQYAHYTDQVPEAITHTQRCQVGLSDARAILQHASRIFFAGSGSSVPAALLGSRLLTRYTEKPAIFAQSSLILDEVHLTNNDAVVLISQGWNRADAALLTHKLQRSPAHLIVLTGHPERLTNYAANVSNVTLVPIFPTIEKIFCRPASVVTGYIKIAQILEGLTGVITPGEQWQAAYKNGFEMTASDINKDMQYVVMASGLLLCAGSNIALSLREGAGRYGVLHEVEDYGHGIYVPDQMHRDNTRYILLTNEDDPHSIAALGRIMPMLSDTKSNYEIWNSKSGSLVGNVELMGRIAKTVLTSIRNDNWDMNNPPGMEENRPFHEVNKAE